MYGALFGTLSKVDAGTLRFFASTSLGVLCHPIRDQESLEFIEIAVIEDQQKLAAVRAQTLNRMRHSWWEEPKVALTDVIDKASALLIHGGDAGVTVKHHCPLRWNMPMQLSDAAGRQAHLHACKCLRNRQFPRRDLPCPPSGVDPLVRQGEGILKRRHRSIVCLRSPRRIRILRREARILRSGDRSEEHT